MKRAVAPLVVIAFAGCGGPPDAPAGDTSDAVSATQINGGTTGAMVRETTPAGFTSIDGTWTVPDYDPSQRGEPWIYYGFGDEASIDVEVGLSFQHGDGTAAKPRRWLPYMRRGSAFYFGDEADRALPGDTFELAARLDGGAVSLWKDGAQLVLSRGAERIDALPVPLDPARTHVRRVVGQALATTYHGETLGTLGPVVFADTRAGRADGSTAWLRDVATWRDVRNGVIYGSVRFPNAHVSHTYDETTHEDEITLFP